MPASISIILSAILVSIARTFPFPPASSCPLSASYANVSFVRFVPNTLEQLHMLHDLSQHACDFHLITPRIPTLFRRNAFILSRPSLHLLHTVADRRALEIRSSDLSADYATLPSQHAGPLPPAAVDASAHYYTLPLLYASFRQLARQHAPHVTVLTYGTSRNNNPLLALHISARPQAPSPPRPVLLLTALLHAREWPTVLAAHAVAQRLSSAAGVRLLDAHGVDVVVAPVCNPDGYVVTGEGDRLWRRNGPVRPLGAYKCGAVDLHTNFPPIGTGFRNAQPCSDEYAGPFPLSEPESAALSALLARAIAAAAGAALLVDVHAYGAAVRGPWHAGRAVGAARLARLDAVGATMARAMTREHGLAHGYARRTSRSVGYLTDWAFAQGALGYTISVRPVRDTDFYRAFALPVQHARLAADEVLAAVVAALPLVHEV